MTSGWLRSWAFLVLVYFSHVYPFYHLHHSHDDGWLGHEISSHPIEVDVEHPSDHHHDRTTPHTNDHQHTYDKHIDWHIIRTQNPRTLTFDDQYLFSSTSFVFTTENNISCIYHRDPICVDGNCVPSIIIRGPPLLG